LKKFIEIIIFAISDFFDRFYPCPPFLLSDCCISSLYSVNDLPWSRTRWSIYPDGSRSPRNKWYVSKTLSGVSSYEEPSSWVHCYSHSA